MIKIKTFEQLDTQTLYEILKIRTEVFVVEQDCVYQDMDDKDQRATHVMIYDNQHKISAYGRIMFPEDKSNPAVFGRILVPSTHRSQGLAKKLIASILEHIESQGYQQTKISAQNYLLRFYEDFGFKAISDVYDLDGIPHINMLR